MFALDPLALIAANEHALREFPNESCGLIVDGAYLPCYNYAADPSRDFVIAGAVQARLHDQGKTVQAIVHSHPNGPLFPSEPDMIGQIESDLPWVIVATDGETCAPPIIWGEGVDQGPLIGRVFRHGVTDCYELVRDTFAAGKDELARQGVTNDWLLPPIMLRPQARADGWWDAKTEAQNRDLYADFKNLGFFEIKASQVMAGDCFLMKLGHKVEIANHGGIYVGNNLILHHLPTRVSRREPIGIWLRAVDVWLRHESLEAILNEQEATNA